MKLASLSAVLLCGLGGFVQAAAPSRPNIVLIIADDQGYGDLGHTGNRVIKTPHIDALAAESSSLTDYHVAPTCSPTRAALLTGHWTDRTGVWHTVNGRSMLRENEVTLAQMLKDAGYATGHFGKWHLGDNYPYRAEDRGFTEVYRHGGGGVGHDARPVGQRLLRRPVFPQREGRARRRFLHRCLLRAGPPFHSRAGGEETALLRLYRHECPARPAAFAAKVSRYVFRPAAAHRRLLRHDYQHRRQRWRHAGTVRELGIEQNTLFIFTTDNGTATGEKVFNAGMRGKKGSEYEGGHRVPFIAHWPAAGWNKKHASDALCHAVDVAPTLLEIAGAKKPDGLKFDGISLRVLLDPAATTDAWPHDRMLVTDSQRVRDPVKWKQTAVMSGPWRLVNGKELYEIKKDPGQKRNVAADHPDIVGAND